MTASTTAGVSGTSGRERRAGAGRTGTGTGLGPPRAVVHWLIVPAIAVLSVTGFLIGDPVLSRRAAPDWVTWIKAIHKFTAYVFIALILARVIMAVPVAQPLVPVDRVDPDQPGAASAGSSRHYASTSSSTGSRRRSSATTRSPGLTYTVLYLMFGVEILTGLALWGVQGDRLGRQPHRMADRPGPAADHPVHPPLDHVAGLGIHDPPRVQRVARRPGGEIRPDLLDLLRLQIPAQGPP